MKTNYYISTYIRAFFEDYLICRRNLSNCTIQSYRDGIKLCVQYAARVTKKPVAQLRVTDLDDNLIVDFLKYLEDSRDNSIQSRNHRLGILCRFFKYISIKEPLLSEYCRKILDIPLKKGGVIPEVTYLEKDEIESMFDVIDTKTALGRRDYAILLFMYNTGARVQETADTRLAWIFFNKPYKVEILGKGRKLRTCPLWPSTVEILQKLIRERGQTSEADGHLFTNRLGQPLSRFGIGNIIVKYSQKASENVLSLKKKTVTPHTIRHTTAMHLLQSGVDINVIRSWLGHANLITTHRYVEIDLGMKQKALEACKPNIKTSHKPHYMNPDILDWLESL
ncbi:MAG: Phage integrase [Candidatus Uhrbacteria bacterium GW2011_GWF2_39_13]|uniref:Phage integrase n=1 Tax=Candidatus Uhrbacteria bacterium GW2011_GWF2_39_13 TaxID=1618995 RepID=A0A0G0MJ77_9BACT|nr:MAG: Phage integrase [Candidatus Uhrbacteria bacterium GW2011_GWF2_39_13]